MNFIPRISPDGHVHEPAYWFVFQADKLLMRSAGETAAVPLAGDISELDVQPLRTLYLGYLEDERGRQIDCYAAEIAADAAIPAGMIADGLRQLYPQLGDTLFGVAGRAVQIVTWDRTHQFCGQCGTPTETLAYERAKRCPHCGLVSYPRLSPAIIIAIVRRAEAGSQILLASSHRYPSGRYSVIAGYVEPGESLEECARREVLEEVGIRIKDIHYFGSQPWPFPNSLMIGFTATYDGGELIVQESELADARWFSAGALPNVPPRMSIARRLIDWFVSQQGH